MLVNPGQSIGRRTGGDPVGRPSALLAGRRHRVRSFFIDPLTDAAARLVAQSQAVIFAAECLFLGLDSN